MPLASTPIFWDEVEPETQWSFPLHDTLQGDRALPWGCGVSTAEPRVRM